MTRLAAHVHTSRVAIAAALTAMATLVLTSGLAPATASPTRATTSRTTYIVRDGFYGANNPGGTYVLLWIRHRAVYHLRFNMIFPCHNISTGEEYDREYDAGMDMPQGRRIPAGGQLTTHFTETEAGRTGEVTFTLTFHRFPLAEFTVDAPHSGEGLEDCIGYDNFRLARSPHNIPMPGGP